MKEGECCRFGAWGGVFVLFVGWKGENTIVFGGSSGGFVPFEGVEGV